MIRLVGSGSPRRVSPHSSLQLLLRVLCREPLEIAAMAQLLDGDAVDGEHALERRALPASRRVPDFARDLVARAQLMLVDQALPDIDVIVAGACSSCAVAG